MSYETDRLRERLEAFCERPSWDAELLELLIDATVFAVLEAGRTPSGWSRDRKDQLGAEVVSALADRLWGE